MLSKYYNVIMFWSKIQGPFTINKFFNGCDANKKIFLIQNTVLCIIICSLIEIINWM